LLAVENDNLVARCLGMVVVILMALGTVFVFSASATLGTQLDLERFYDLASLRRILFFPFACSVLYLASCIDYRRFSMDKGVLRSPTTWVLAAAVVMLTIVLLPSFGAEINQARRWFRIQAGPATISFQPSELAKWAVIFFVAGICARLGEDIRFFRKRFVPVCGVVAVPVALILVEDMGTAAFISLIVFFMLIIAGARLWHLLLPLPLGLLAFAVVLLKSPWRLQRIAAFLHPEDWSDSAAYQATQSLVALSSGGLMGKGLGRGICKYGHLPEDTTDFIFAIIGEELGFTGTAVVIVLFIVFLVLGLAVVRRCRDPFGQLLAAGITLAVAVQAALNIGVVTVVLPTKGIPLPFVSSGGTSMLLSAAAVGILLNIAKQSPPVERKSGR